MWPLVKWQNLLLLAALITASAWALGYVQGEARERDRASAAELARQQRLALTRERIAEMAAAMAAAAAEQTQRAREAEDDARANPDACRLPGAGSLRRLEWRWTD